MHVNPVRHIVLAKLHLDVGLVLSEFDDLPVLAALVGLGRGSQIDRFQNIGLSLSIITVQDIDPFV